MYANSSNDYFVIDPPGTSLSITFTSMLMQNYYDYVTVYDGIGTSGTLLVSYANGTTLPNNGNAITAPSGSATVVFTSNSYSNAQGFALSWTSSGLVSPSASFSVSQSNPAINQSISFTNNTINGGGYAWDFGDGNTSTAVNPSHSYTTGGNYTVKLVTDNCTYTDSTSQVINVQNAPQFSISPDSLNVSVTCGSNYSTSLTIRDTAGGNLLYNISAEDVNANPIIFRETFESGIGQFSRDQFASTGFTSAASTTVAAQGSQSLQLSGYTGYDRGVKATMNTVQPDKISYQVYPSYSYNSGYTSILDTTGFYNYMIVRTYFRYGALNFNTGSYVPSLNLSTNSWHKIELRNIDFGAKTFDIYVNGNLHASNVLFYNNMATGVNRVNLYTQNTATYYFDDFRMEKDLGMPVSINPSAGSLSSGNIQTVNITGNTNGMLAGVYNYMVNVRTNASNADSLMAIPMQLTVNGSSPLSFDQPCINKGNIYTGTAYTDSLQVVNLGCDSVPLTTVSFSHSDLASSLTSFSIAPYDTTYLAINFNTIRTGAINDTIYFTNSDSTYAVCYTANSTSAAAISTDSATYTIYHTGCPDSVSFDMWVYNNGQDTLNWGTGQSVAPLTDDFESVTFNSALWAAWGSSIASSSSCGTISGSRSLLFNYSGSRYIETVALNTMAGGTIDFKLNQSTCDNAESGEGITISYSTNNGISWTVMASNLYVSQGSTLSVSQAIPAAAQGSGVKFRISQPYFSGGTYDAWIIDDFSITTGVSNSLSFSPDTASVAPLDSMLVTATIPTTGLSTGVYNFPAVFTSNDPSNNFYHFAVNLHLTGQPNIAGPVTCFVIDSTIVGTSKSDSLLITNSGCGDLILGNATTIGSSFTVSAMADTLLPGDSIYMPVTFAPTGAPGLITDTLNISSNDTALNICLQAYALGAPVAVMDTSAIFDTIYSCNDSINIQRYLSNSTGLSGLNYQVAGDNQRDLQSVLDTFKAANATVYSQIPNPYNFYDGVFGFSIGDGGGDMYDGGNYVSTNFTTGAISYSNDAVLQSTSFGTNGAYFTYKATGLWLLAADLDGVTDFEIYGNLGADGSGSADGAVLSTTVNGKSYTGFVKRVYNAWDPSVNHLVIIEDNPNASHTFNTNTNYDQHDIAGLSGTKRLYYLLYAGSNGGYIDNAATTNIMNAFLAIAEGNSLPSWVTVQPDSGAVNTGDSTLIDIWMNSTGLSNGNHSGVVTVNTNDPATPVLRIPLNLTVIGSPQIERVNSLACVNFDTVQQGATATDTVWVRNYGCDTLRITSASGNNSAFSIQNALPLNVAPADTVPLLIDFSPTNIGQETDTLLINNNDSVLPVCVRGVSVGAPVLSLGTDTISVDVNKCKIIANENFMVNNTGQGPMNYNISFGGFTGSSHITYNSSGANTLHTFNNVPQSDTLELRLVFNGDYDAYNERFTLYIDNSYYYGYVNNNNRSYQADTVILQFTGSLVQNWTSDGTITFDLNNYYLVDGGAGSFHQVDIRLASQVNWVAVVGSSSGNIAANGSANKNLIFNSSALALGTYYTNMNISNNSVGNPNASVVVEMNVVSTPEIALSDTCVQFPLTLLGDTTTRKLTIYNDGCQPLNIASILSTNNAAFKVSPSNGSVATGDSLTVTVQFIPTSVTNYSASMLINNNDSNQVVCLTGYAGAVPDADFQFSVTNNCFGSVSFTDHTTQASPSSYYWDFGDGNNSQLPNPTHQFALPGTYSVLMRVSNNFGFDTIRKDVTVNPLVADFSMSTDTVDIGDTLYLTDQSITANSWIWSFGDGGSSTLQNPQHVYQSQGKYNVRLTVTDSNSCVRFVEKFVVVTNSIGTNELSFNNNLFSLYPNPNSGRFFLESKGQNWSAYELRIMDMRGAIISQFTDLDNSREIELEVSNLKAGVYQILILEEGTFRSRKSFVIQ